MLPFVGMILSLSMSIFILMAIMSQSNNRGAGVTPPRPLRQHERFYIAAMANYMTSSGVLD